VQERNYHHFLKLYARYIDLVAETFAFCLLKNHFHLLVRIKSEEEISKTLKVSLLADTNINPSALSDQHNYQTRKPLGSNYVSKQFSDFFNAYAKAINTAFGRTGSLFQHPFGRVMVKNERQFWNVIAYIHQNPQKHKFVDDFREWRWSLYGIMLSENPTHLQRDVVLEWFGGEQQYLERHKEMVSEADNKWIIDEDED
jgi:putative transposase